MAMENEGEPGIVEVESPLGSPDDIVNLIGRCFEQGARALLVRAEDLTPGFFDLSTGEAGAILQKLRTYKIRVAVVMPLSGGPRVTERFREMAAEERKGNYFRLFSGREAAIKWLTEKQEG